MDLKNIFYLSLFLLLASLATAVANGIVCIGSGDWKLYAFHLPGR